MKPKRTPKKAARKAATKRSKRPKSAAKRAEAASAMPVLIPQAHGGALLSGGQPGQTPGTGRPKNEIRERLRGIAFGKGLGFLDETLDGKVTVQLFGKCMHCGETSPIDPVVQKSLLDRISASVDQRLKANEQALRFGVGTQSEQVISDDDIKAWEGHVARYLHDSLTARGWTREDVGALLVGLDEHMKAFDPRERKQ